MHERYVRIEPQTRATTLKPGLAAQVWDPAWMLSRQWVLGELAGEDAGTPVMAQCTLEQHPVTSVWLGGDEFAYDPASLPLDALVEGRSVQQGRALSLRQRIEAGQALARALTAAGENAALDQLLRLCAFAALPADVADAQPGALALWRLAAGRVPDAELAFALDPLLPGWSTAAKAAFATWRAAWQARYCEPAGPATRSAWQEDRLEYRCALRCATLPNRFIARTHPGHGLDWSQFAEEASGEPSQGTAQSETITRVPTPVRFAGMPNPRYWAMEDSALDLGAVEAGATDLARMAMLQFAFTYGNDAFLLPLELRSGCIARIARLDVADNFGQSLTVPPAARDPAPGRGGWSFLGLTGDTGGSTELLFVAPVAAAPISGAVLAGAELVRDEMANLAWAIETWREGEDGRPLPLADMLQRLAPDPPRPSTAGLQYRLQGQVPRNRYPLLLQPGAKRMVELRKLDTAQPPPPAGLLPSVDGQLHDEEIPREGLRIEQRDLLARWHGGTTVLWRRNERRAGSRERSPGIIFDYLEAEPRSS